jgi:hypothetical protein
MQKRMECPPSHYLGLGVRVVLVLVWMPFHGELAICLLDLILSGLLRHAEHLPQNIALGTSGLTFLAAIQTALFW